jgi:ATP-dependent Clp protease ATP-binding subunit ClpC
LSGTGVRGALSERLQALVAEIARAEGKVIVFIDEIHGVVSAEGGADSLTGSLKTALARGEFPCIGATTEVEYRRIFERDAALARRFTRVDIDEPSADAAFAILGGIAPEYERHHGVTYAPEALRAAVDMSVRFMSERHLPDKAIGLIDQAAARVRRRGGTEVDLQAVAEVVSEHAGVSVERLTMRDGDALMALEAHLQQRVIGQPLPIAAIADALRKGAAGFRGSRPLGTFLFLGPTGVGKTEMAKAISELLFPGQAMTRIDMSDLSEAHAVARLLGAPPGYVGHEEGGQLTEPVRGRPYQLVLLDEVEKAHRDVLLALLPLLDEGRLTDGRGRCVDFRNTVVVMTSNLGAVPAESRARVGFGAEAESEQLRSSCLRALAAARAALPPELWNRIDEPLYFQALDRDAVLRIAAGMVADVVALMQRQHGVTIEVDAGTFETLIAAGGHDPALGARPMRRTVGRVLEARLARAILSGEFCRGDVVVVRGRGHEITLELRQAVDAAE